ncbi:DinB superfamily protein [Nakamurella panacisegetis]|uniref:DinB superfamily protein n=1 Tax=Nakamurella panacisegetis TaxID=1090615 RepID=A0A1H0J0H8_9ACTN|nr:DinB family protein [Nakamurella panacisegetis]SDO36980.1 DinB superfamily protein [Nakamurella panacisegetis]
MAVNWTTELLDQLNWHWDRQLRPRLDGLTDDEYFWEPVRGAWNLRPRGEAVTPMAAGSGDYVLDYAFPEPRPAPVTTIAWRIGHLLVGVFGMRNASHFGGPALDYPTYRYPEHADEALHQLDEMQAAWRAGVATLDELGMAAPSGEAGHEDAPMATLVLHINREVIHHGAEIALLRDLYAWR